MNRPQQRITRGIVLPEGTIPVGLSLLIAGVATYAFFLVGEKAVGGPDEFAPLTSLWFATFALAPGFYLPIEQELGRAISDRRARGLGSKPLVRRIAMLGIGITSAVLLVSLIASKAITDEYFNGEWVLLIALMFGFTAYAPAHIARGICAGMGRFRSYAVAISGDGVVRIAGCLVLWAVGISTIGAYGFLIALAPLIPVSIVAMRGDLHVDDGPPAMLREVSQNLGWLLAGTACAAMLLNAGPIAAELLLGESTAEQELISIFGKGVLIARVPLFLFQAVQAALLPRLSRLAARGEFEEFKDGYRSLMLVVSGVGIIGVLGAFVLGPFAIDLVYGVELSGRTLAMLALSSALYMAALATGQAVIALGGHRDVAIGWVLGVIAFLIGTWLSSDRVPRRIEIGLVISSATALACFAGALRSRLRTGAQMTPGSAWDAMTDHPM